MISKIIPITLAVILAGCASDQSSPILQSSITNLPGWKADNVHEVWPAFIKSCNKLGNDAVWAHPCKLASSIDSTDANTIRLFFENNFIAKLVTAPDGSSDALITGYFEPILAGSRIQNELYRFPLYSLPIDIQEGVPYKTRREIDSGEAHIPETVIAYLKDDLDRYLAHVQGSCKIRFADGSLTSAVYAGKNSHKYVSIGKILVARGEVPEDEISMQAIREWAKENPDKLNELLWSNPSYTFFLEQPATEDGPPGAMNVGLTKERSAAIDPDRVPFGYPIWIDTTTPEDEKPYQHILASQDKGAAIKGVKADVFFGTGDVAGAIAGKMKQSGHIWVLWPISSVNSN
jgi:membrane-bound lytic murein transglycosylase A